MTNLQTIAGSVVWMLISALLFFAALEPVSVNNSPVQVASVPAESHAA